MGPDHFVGGVGGFSGLKVLSKCLEGATTLYLTVANASLSRSFPAEVSRCFAPVWKYVFRIVSLLCFASTEFRRCFAMFRKRESVRTNRCDEPVALRGTHIRYRHSREPTRTQELWSCDPAHRTRGMRDAACARTTATLDMHSQERLVEDTGRKVAAILERRRHAHASARAGGLRRTALPPSAHARHRRAGYKRRLVA